MIPSISPPCLPPGNSLLCFSLVLFSLSLLLLPLANRSGINKYIISEELKLLRSEEFSLRFLRLYFCVMVAVLFLKVKTKSEAVTFLVSMVTKI